MKHWDWAAILAEPRSEGGNVTIRLYKGDTAYLPGTSKRIAKALSDTAELTYYISPVTSALVDSVGSVTTVQV